MSGEDKKPLELLTNVEYDELLQKLGEAEQKSNQYWERILRMQAENENTLRRSERDVASAHKYALEKWAQELLPIVDSLELCLSYKKEDMSEEVKPIVEGVDLTLKMFYTALEKHGLRQVNPVSEPFDSTYQQAISLQPDASQPAGTVLSVLQKGYTLNDRLLRPALVVVSKAAE